MKRYKEEDIVNLERLVQYIRNDQMPLAAVKSAIRSLANLLKSRDSDNIGIDDDLADALRRTIRE